MKAVQSESVDEWMVWKTRHLRHYPSMDDEVNRYKIWLLNKQFIDEHNRQANKHGYRVAMNQFGDMVSELPNTNLYILY